MKKPAFVIVILLTVISGMSVTRAIVINSFSPSGVNLNATQNELSRYNRENTLMKEELLSLTSLTNMTEIASKKGFVNSTTSSVVLMTSPLPFAFSR